MRRVVFKDAHSLDASAGTAWDGALSGFNLGLTAFPVGCLPDTKFERADVENHV